MITTSNFKPAWWLRNAHLQTILAKFFRKKQWIALHKSSLETPDDDFIDLAWTALPERNNTKPIVVVLHGLEGSADSHYAKGMLSAIKARGWIGLLMHFRGCSGRPNRQGRSYHSGDTRDISFLSEWLHNLYPQAPKAAVGFSLGGNVLTRYLAEQQNHPYRAATVICAPLDLTSCSRHIAKGSSRIYQKYLVDMLKANTLVKVEQQLLPQICPTKLAKVSELWDFDHMVTAPINGFASAEDYYHKASGKPVMSDIHVPCLFIHAADDPFLDHEQIVPKQTLPEHIQFEISKKGGHVGFISGNNPFKPDYWLEQRAPDYLSEFL
ncbi:hydrolase [Thalassotalea euphylliae]|uniref:Hydrolase n=1 Tax=Thalassotalea euphylliae TaxID=1655234 RepID=A0A3E0TVF1_9GAMM|nr:hydrolase [Thalassotalea euphylliae]REL28449.1 hydrolase [Thalassotalea euphylliae]